MTNCLIYVGIGIPSPMSCILIVLAILLLVGGKKIPELMKGLGQGMKDFKNASKEAEDDSQDKKVEE
jgi:sec-independent protein translocase protein TatA|tara:strand:+ start:72 stop:272 length:201 start_codon:yes stop_codon:yes gene_type:complete